MPNWCSNYVVISGPDKDVKKIRELVRPDDDSGQDDLIFDFDKIIPQPPGLLDTSDEIVNGAFPKWYDWRIEHWGTKWNSAYGEILQDESGKLTYRFDTAWGPPTPVLLHLSELFPTVTITHFAEEPGMGYIGETHYENGCLTDMEDPKVGADWTIDYCQNCGTLDFCSPEGFCSVCNAKLEVRL